MGNIKWTLQGNPAIFGTNIHLICHLPMDACCNDYRKWNAGNQYNLIIINGLSYNSSKYIEELKEKDKVSVLTILSFSEEDIGIPYECVYGFQKYRSVLELSEDIFEFHPTEKLPVIPTVRGYNLSFDIQFIKVFPIPFCQAVLGMQNVSSFLFVNVKRNDLFYELSLKFKYSSSGTTCKDSLTVVCTVGKTVFTVVNYKACHSPDAKDISWMALDVILNVVAVAMIFVAIYFVWIATRNRPGGILEQLREDNEVLQTLAS
ncbi:uncharacterized protein LOC127717858 isoform X2 [Mytilus californianus]|uniref:uncharacterized protein LOC127717858 isoform X2 n=1 Tax=Mytilus californianus TaxID=6549 RepID=UPI002247D834|nr:uncharacterized protein LOC127717858 isoform X2 [Mytilus californianus]